MPYAKSIYQHSYNVHYFLPFFDNNLLFFIDFMCTMYKTQYRKEARKPFYHRFNYVEDADLKLILDAFNINISKKLCRRAELKSIKQALKFKYAYRNASTFF